MYRGADGAAGDIGHIRVGGHDTPVCRCGNVACLEALAGGAALARQLKAEDYDVHTGRDVVRLSRGGDPTAVRLVREAGRILGEVLASLMNFFNPRVIVIGGDVAEVYDADDADAAAMAIEHVLSPEAVKEALLATRPTSQRSG